jgi:hypothetical protein
VTTRLEFLSDPPENFIQPIVPRHNSVRLWNQQHRKAADHPICYNSATMFDPFRLWFSSVLCVFRSRRSLMLNLLVHSGFKVNELTLKVELSGNVSGRDSGDTSAASWGMIFLR